MKKLFLILVLCLMWSGSAYSQAAAYDCKIYKSIVGKMNNQYDFLIIRDEFIFDNVTYKIADNSSFDKLKHNKQIDLQFRKTLPDFWLDSKIKKNSAIALLYSLPKDKKNYQIELEYIEDIDQKILQYHTFHCFEV